METKKIYFFTVGKWQDSASSRGFGLGSFCVSYAFYVYVLLVIASWLREPQDRDT